MNCVKFCFWLLASLVIAPPVLLAAGELVVFDPFSDGGTTQGEDPLDVHWFTSDPAHAIFSVVEDPLLDPEPPNRVGSFLINNPDTVEKDDYIFFALPEVVNLAVGEALQVSFLLRFEGGLPRADASRTGVSLAYRSPTGGNTPWPHAGNREYFFFTSFGSGGFGGSIRKSSGIQILNTGTVLAANTPTVNLGSGVGSVFFEVARVDAGTMRIRYGLNGMPPREAFDTEDITTAFSHVFWRYRRATHAPLESLRIDDVRVVRTAVDLSEPEPRMWYVRADGDNAQSGDTPDAALASINYALSWARAGDTIEVGEGVYREAIFFPYSGEPDAPITLRAATALNGSFERVVVSAFEPLLPGMDWVGAWEPHAGNTWRIALPPGRALTLGRNLLEVDGEVLLPARWPTALSPVDFDRRAMAEATDGSVDASKAHSQPPYPGTNFFDATYTDAALAAFSPDVWAGARIDVCAGHNWWPKTGVVTGNDAGQLFFRFRFETNWNPAIDTPKEGDRYALWGHLGALDTPGEFFIDVHGVNGPANTLYVWFPDSGPPDGRTVSLLARSDSVVLGNRSHIVMEGIHIRGGTLSMSAGSTHNRFDHVEVDYGAVNRNRLRFGSGASVLLAGDHHIFTNGRVGHTFGRSIEVVGYGSEVSNTVSHDASSHLLTLFDAVGAHAAMNTLFRSGDTAIDIGAKSTLIEFNHAYHAGMRITDIAVLNTWNSGDMEGTEIRYNWVHSNLAPWDASRSWWGGQGIRLDSGGAPLGCSHARIHHNVVWNTTSRSSLTFWGLEEGMLNFGNSRIDVFHNTLEDTLVFGGSGSVAGGDVRNNIARAFNNPVNSVEGLVFTDNLFRDNAVAGNLQADPGYISAPNRNFQLRADSAAIGVGSPVSGVTETADHNYLGAYNPAVAPWTPGARLRSVDLPDLLTSVETDPLGQTRIMVTGLPAGRTFPDAFSMRLGGREAGEWRARYFPATHSVTGVFHIDLEGLGASALIEFSLDGVEWVVPAESTIALPVPTFEVDAGWVAPVAGGTEHILSGEHLAGPVTPLQLLEIAGLSGNDFVSEAFPWIVDTAAWVAQGMSPDGRDLRFLAWDGEAPVRHHVEYGIGRANTLIWLISGANGADGEVVSFEDRSRIFLSFGDESVAGGDDPQVLTDSFPALGSTARLLHLRAHDLAETAGEGDPVSTWPDAGPLALPVLQPDAASRPQVRLDAFGGLPSIAFDGVNDHLDVNGAAGIESGSARIFTVFRNPEPGAVRWQRLYSARTNTAVTDFETGFYAIVPTTPQGDPLTNPGPTIRDMNQQGHFSGENFRIGRRSLANFEHFRGEIAEIIALSGEFVGVPRDQLLRYLRRKYGIADRPTVTVADAEAFAPLRVFVGGAEALWLRRESDGSLSFGAPPLTPETPLPAIEDVRAVLADGREFVLADAFTYTLDGSAPHPFALWASDLPPEMRGPLDRVGSHGISNLMRFAFGQAALETDYPTGLPLVYDMPGAEMRMELIRRSGGSFNGLAYEADGLRYILETSADLGDWSSVAWDLLSAEVIDDRTERVVLHLPLAPPTTFYRIRVVLVDG
ncbi:MAG: hypothetical protein JJT96_06355 [Opitutales bacterium]|nr:hypothetical protein [Opitutales bacterium]